MITPILAPPTGSVGLPLKQTVSLTFPTEMDVSSINPGTFFVVGLKDQLWTDEGGTIVLGNPRTQLSVNLLDSPALVGAISGSFKFERLAMLSDTVVTTVDDGTGPSAGNLYRTRVTFTPSEVLKPNTQYGVLLAGEISTNTVFDPIVVKNAASTGSISFLGTYAGTADDTFYVTIVSSGTEVTAQFVTTRDSIPTPSATTQVSQFKDFDLGSDIFARFAPGIYTIGDIWEVHVSPQVQNGQLFSGTFSTGEPQIIEMPATDQPPAITNIKFDGEAQPVSGTNGPFVVTYTTPADGSFDIPIQTNEFVVEFSKAIDPTSLTNAKIKVIMEALFPDVCEGIATTEVNYTTEVVGNKLFIRI